MVARDSRKTNFHGPPWERSSHTAYTVSSNVFFSWTQFLIYLSVSNLPVEDPIDCSRNNNHASAFIRIKIYKFCSIIMYSIVRWHQNLMTWNRIAQRKRRVCSLGKSMLTVAFFSFLFLCFWGCLTLHALNYPLDLPFALLQSLERPAS